MPKKLAVEIVADASGLRKGLQQAESATHKFGKAALVAGAGIAGGLVVGLKKSVDAAKEAEVSQAKMVATLKIAGISYRAHAKEIDNVIQRTSKLAALDDEDLQDAFSGLARTTGNVNQALKDTALAADIARAKNISLEAATSLVTKAELGKAGALTRAGIAVDKNASKVELLDTLHRKFAGSAEAYGKTAAGAQDRFRVAIENLQEKLGSALLPMLSKAASGVATLTTKLSESKTVQEVMATVVRVLKGAWDVASDTVKRLSQTVQAHREELIRIGNFLNATLVPVVRFTFQTVLPTAISVAISAIGGFITAIDKIITTTGRVVTEVRADVNAIVGFFRELPGRVAGFMSALPGRIGAAISGAMGDLQHKLGELFSWKKIVGWIRDALGFGSPSPHFMAIGHDMVDSMIRGVGAATGLLAAAVKRLAKQALGEIAGAGRESLNVFTGEDVPQSPGGNVGLGMAMAAQRGWTGNQWAALYKLWQGESGWSTTATNRSSGAYGIPQALPASKMASAGPDWRTNPATQIRWGLNYIAGRYGNPANAYSAWLSRSPHWYGEGGSFVATHPQIIGVGENGPEFVSITPLRGGAVTTSAGLRLGDAFVRGLRSTINRTSILRPIAEAKAAADTFVEGAGVDNMTGAGEILAAALTGGFRDTLLGPQAASLTGAVRDSLIGKAFGSTTPTSGGLYPGSGVGPGGNVIGGQQPLVVNVYNAGSVVTERELTDGIYRALLKKQGQNTSLGFKAV